MNPKHLFSLSDKFYLYRFYLLFIALALHFVLPPIASFPVLAIAIKLFTIYCLLLSGANFIPKNKMHLRNAWFVFGLIILFLSMIMYFDIKNVFIVTVNYMLMFIFFIVITITLLKEIFTIHEVTADVIIGSFCGYLLIGIISSFLFVLLEYSSPHSLSGLSNNINDIIPQILYFAFTCLTTLGFGDILPVTITGQKLAVFTAAIGQFYIAVVVAILISRFMQGSKK